uniref:Uncharacterized protein n=1 Tax=Leersia perrieri TaxID=77586 RepID=A0A0D9WV07_9ORYZ
MEGNKKYDSSREEDGARGRRCRKHRFNQGRLSPDVSFNYQNAKPPRCKNAQALTPPHQEHHHNEKNPSPSHEHPT